METITRSPFGIFKTHAPRSGRRSRGSRRDRCCIYNIFRCFTWFLLTLNRESVPWKKADVELVGRNGVCGKTWIYSKEMDLQRQNGINCANCATKSSNIIRPNSKAFTTGKFVDAGFYNNENNKFHTEYFELRPVVAVTILLFQFQGKQTPG